MSIPFTHDLSRLLTLMESLDTDVPSSIRHAVELTVYAVAGRYPTPEEEVDEAEYRYAVAVAEDVLA